MCAFLFSFWGVVLGFRCDLDHAFGREVRACVYVILWSGVEWTVGRNRVKEIK